MAPQLAQLICGFPERLHPASQVFLDNYVAGVLRTEDFLRFFSLPNSDYIALASCFVTMFTGAGPSV